MRARAKPMPKPAAPRPANRRALLAQVHMARAWFARCLAAQGNSQRQIARHMRTTENTVRLLLTGGPDTRQMGLPL